MKTFALFLSCVLAIGLSGCAACCNPYDFDYPAFGGKWERVDRQQGRVGSAFYDPSQMEGGEAEMTTELEVESAEDAAPSGN